MHLLKEEQVLFPCIRGIEAHAREGGPEPVTECVTVRNPIRQMKLEHTNAGQALDRMRGLASGYRPPEDACESFRALYEGLQALEADLHEHIHLENNILFPRAIELEARTVGA
jgi:regulator of cell morphogenesis and NO signaling